MPDDTLNPNFSIRVGDTELEAGVRALIESVEYESADGIADVAKIVAKNPNFILSDRTVLAPGNEVSIFMGYGGELSHIGRVRIYKVRPTFPQAEMPTIEITGYTRDHEMMHNSPPQAAPAGRAGGRRRGARRAQSQSGRRFRNLKYSEAVEQRAADYNFSTDIDPTPEAPTDFIQKAGMSDYDFVNGLANLTGFLFWVDGDENGEWTLHFKDPERLNEQETRYRFEYNLGDLSTLFQFQPEFLVSEAIAQIRVRVQDPTTGQVFEAEFTEDNLEGSPELLFDPSADLETETVEMAPETATAVQLYIGDYSFEEITNRRFASEADAVRWARQWFRRSRENFIQARGFAIGVEAVRARQVHEVNGVGIMYDGLYYFSRVKHRCDGQDGYTIDFNGRKQTPRVP
ncbi:MAG: phage late control D family protein [Acidimicrobiia bacterium]